ncbi:MAG TPA: PAS domain S-box protein [Methanospirillum sp.]|uniref:PAS domain S-box protein n=1 Tax=Methanospirillum sp. TaxID=45200 RepID=UPI002CE44E0A|nr:PAS domain S-box protein [Methanospirillum sp.]HWQ65073.1 PAS domain S-box protein [Methanospirillum sp.]
MLYVDDEQMLLEICKIFLEKTGELQVQTEFSVSRALERIQLEVFDVIVSDYQMPGMDGIEFLKQIRSSGNTIPFIIFTGRGREEVAIAALKEGADFYLQKGGDPTSQFAEMSNHIRQLVRRRRAESALRENEQKYHTLFDSAFDAILLLDNTLIIECNPPAAALFGEPMEAVVGRSPMDFSPEYQDDGSLSQERGSAQINTALSGKPLLFEWKHQRADGTVFDSEVSLTRIMVNEKNLLLGIIRDITVRKRNEEELRKKGEELAASYEELLSTEEELQTQYQTIARNEQALKSNEAKLNAILQGSPIPQFVIDTDHRVIHWNNALVVSTGINESEIIGTDQHWRVFYQEERPCLADLLLDGFVDHLQEWYGDKVVRSAIVSDAYSCVDFFPHLGKRGIWFSFTATLIRDDTGNVIGALETLEDITNQKKATLALADSESKYRGVIENLQDIFYRSDLEGRLVMVSPSVLPLMGYKTLEECLGKNISDDFYADPTERDRFISDVYRNGSVSNYLVTLKKHDGTPVRVSTSSHIYYGEDGRPAGIEGTFRDMTEQIETHEQLKRNETILSAVINESPVPLFVINSGHQVIYWNKALEKYSNITADETIGTNRHWRAFYHSERPCLADLLVQENIEEIPRWYLGKYAPSRLIDGAYEAVDFFPEIGEQGCWLYFTAAPIRDSDGVIIGAVEVLQDISDQKAAEEEIQTLTRFQESIIMSANVWLMVLDKDGKIVIWNHAAEEITGYAGSEVSGRSWIWKALYPDPIYRQSVTSAISRVINNNLFLQDFQTTILTKSGEQKEILWNTRILGGADFSAKQYVAIGIDISGRIRAELALRDSENTLQAIVKGSPIPQFVIDRDHRIIHWNTALEAYSSLAAEEMVGTDQHWRAFYHEKRPCIADLVVDGADAATSTSFPEHYEESQLIEGGYQAVDFFPTMGGGSWLFFTAAPIRDDTGKVIGAVETLEDITERKMVENSLLESEERFRTVFTLANDAIFLFRIINGEPERFVEVNDTACSLLGYHREELLDLPPSNIFDSDSKAREPDNMSMLQKTGHATYESVFLTKTGEPVPVEISSHSYEFRGDQMVLSIGRDISERKRFESAIQNANKKLNLLSSITRHDILNQLTALSGYLELSDEVAGNDESQGLIAKEKKTADTITRQILFTRDYQTVGIQSPLWQNLSSVIQKAANLLDTREVALSIDVHYCEIFADPLLEKVFFNLIDNSLRYGKGLTKITFSTEKREDQTFLVCTDDGGGIPLAEKENIFNRRYFSNTGFGLFLSREILSITGLSIIESGEFGVGARFEIAIPPGGIRSCK